MVRLFPTTLRPEPKPVVLGPRTRREIELQVRVLEARLKPTLHDRHELARLRQLLNTGGRDNT